MPTARSIALHLTKGIESLSTHLPAIGHFRPARGTFSALESLKSGQLAGKRFLDFQAPGPSPPGSITVRCGMNQHDHQPWPVFWTTSDDAELVGRLRHWRDPKDRICLEGCYHHPSRHRLGEDHPLSQLILPPAQPLPGAWTSVISNWGNGGNYFHWITDCLTRLWLWEQLPEPTKILIPANAARYILESIALLGIADKCESFEAPCLKPERFYFCSPLTMTGVWNPLGFDWLRERFRPFLKASSSGPPIFLTRRAKTRVPAELAEIERTFETKGFRIIDCGTLGFREQLEMASAAPAIAGIHGAAMTNILWSHPGTPVLEIFQPAWLNGCYEQIAFQGKLDYTAHVLEGESPLRQIEDWLAGER
jgi:hypothetical protein